MEIRVLILPITSKLFECAMEEQLSNYFETIFNPYLSAFRKGFSCQSVLLAITEEWRKALNRNEYVAAIRMDLSKAFDCLPPNLIKQNSLHMVCLKMQSCRLKATCLTETNVLSSQKNVDLFLNIIKGVSHG